MANPSTLKDRGFDLGYVVNWMFGNKAEDKNKALIDEHKACARELKELQTKIERINGFFKENPDLKKLADEAMQKDAHNIVVLPSPSEQAPDSDILIKIQVLRDNIIICKAMVRESEAFILRNAALYECYQKHIEMIPKLETSTAAAGSSNVSITVDD
jgi:hypothetical protein